MAAPAGAKVGHAGDLREAELKRAGSCGACRVGEGGALPAAGALAASLVAALAWLFRRRGK